MEKLIIFRLNNQKYALALSAVERIVRSLEITPLPKAPDIVSGVINLQGRILPVYNIRRRFRLPDRAVSINDQLIVARTSRRAVSLVVDEVDGLAELPVGEIVPPGDILPEMEYVKGAVKIDNEIILIHDLDRFLTPAEEETLEKSLNKAKPKR